MNYFQNNDSQPKKKEKALRRCLLPSLPKKTIPIPDIYLCEHCDAEFSSHVEMQKHEKVCYEIVIDDDDEDDDGDDNDNNDDNNADDNDNDNDNEAKEQSEKDNYIDNFSDSSEEIEILEHIKPNVVQTTQKNNLMSYLGLEQVINQNKSSMKKLKGHCSESPCKRWVNVDKCLHKNRNVEFSSSFGRKMLEHCVKRDLINKIEKNISLYESYCGTTITTNRELRELSDFKVSYRRGKKTDWDHCYSFGKSQRIKRYYTLKTGKKLIQKS